MNPIVENPVNTQERMTTLFDVFGIPHMRNVLAAEIHIEIAV